MCEFVGNHVDAKKLSETEKKKLRQQLERRKKQLQERVDKLEKAIQKFK